MRVWRRRSTTSSVMLRSSPRSTSRRKGLRRNTPTQKELKQLSCNTTPRVAPELRSACYPARLAFLKPA